MTSTSSPVTVEGPPALVFARIHLGGDRVLLQQDVAADAGRRLVFAVLLDAIRAVVGAQHLDDDDGVGDFGRVVWHWRADHHEIRVSHRVFQPQAHVSR